MLCIWHRWRISQALDSDKPLSPFLERHVRKCPSCRDHLQFSLYFADQAKKDLSSLMGAESLSPVSGILSRLDGAPAAKQRRSRLIPVRALAGAGAGLAVLVLCLVLFLPFHNDGLTEFNPLSEWESAHSALRSALQKMDSPYRTELENIKTSLTSTADFLHRFYTSIGPESLQQ